MAESAKPAELAQEQVSDIFVGTSYRAIERIGSGDMSEVYLAEHRQLGKRSAIKVLRSQLASNAALVDRLRVEYQVLGRLNHPNIVSLEGVGATADGRPFIVMELLRGMDLGAVLAASGALPVIAALKIAGYVLCALSEAHAIGIVHRDIKPSNVFISRMPGDEIEVKVLDFGVARILPEVSELAPSPVQVPTAEGIVVGTPRYVSPEDALGQKVDHRADIYGVGLLLYMMLTGKGPFDHVGRDTGALMAHAFEEPKAPSCVAENAIPPELDRIVLKALSKDPGRRFASALEFLDALKPLWNAAICPSRLRDTGIASSELLAQYQLAVQESARPESRKMNRIAFVLGFVLFGLATAILLWSYLEAR
jgi:eukaryotic-like serine/threonine-protein kinase